MRIHIRLPLVLIAALMGLSSLTAATTNSAPTFPGISRAIEVRVERTRQLRGMVATGRVRITGSVEADSFDSRDAGKSSNGKYDPAKAGEKAFVGTTSKKSGDFELTGSAKVVGQIGTGAPGVFNNGGSASVGSRVFVEAGKTGLESSGYLQDDLNLNFPDAVLPFEPSSLLPQPQGGTVNGILHTYVLTDGNYAMENLKLTSKQTVMVTGKAVLYVKDTLDLAGQSSLIIAPGASLDIYVGKTASMAGGGVVNQNGKAEHLNYYGLKENTQILLRGNAAFIGIIYAPSARLDVAGTADFLGASVSRELDLTGNFAFHYDEGLNGKGMLYVPIAWREL